MNLHKKLNTFYKKSKEFETARLKIKELKKTAVKLNENNKPNLSGIQDPVDHHMETKALSDAVGKPPRDLFGVQEKTLNDLSAIGFPGKTVIRINDEHYGNIGFWYEGTNLYFKEENKNLSSSL